MTSIDKKDLDINLESSSNKKELLTALFASSVINTLMLDITWKFASVGIGTDVCSITKLFSECIK